MIAWKAGKGRLSKAGHLPGRPLTPRTSRGRYAAFAVGLSFGFIDDADLVAAPFDRLVRFKEENLALLHQSQACIERIALAFGDIKDDDRFDSEVERLRQQAWKARTR